MPILKNDSTSGNDSKAKYDKYYVYQNVKFNVPSNSSNMNLMDISIANGEATFTNFLLYTHYNPSSSSDNEVQLVVTIDDKPYKISLTHNNSYLGKYHFYYGNPYTRDFMLNMPYLSSDSSQYTNYYYVDYFPTNFNLFSLKWGGGQKRLYN